MLLKFCIEESHYVPLSCVIFPTIQRIGQLLTMTRPFHQAPCDKVYRALDLESNSKLLTAVTESAEVTRVKMTNPRQVLSTLLS